MKMIGGGLTSIAISLFFFYLYYTAIKVDKSRSLWPETSATIMSSSIETVIIGETGISKRTRTLRPVWENKVSYDYSVKGVKYHGNRVSFNPTYDEKSQDDQPPSDILVKIRDQFSVGSKVSVHYDPNQPERSYLIHKPGGGKIALLLLGAGLSVIGFIMILLGTRSKVS